MVGGAGLDGCPGTFNTTIMLIVARDSRIRMIVFFMYVSIWLQFTAVNSTGAGIQHLSSNYAPGRPLAMGCNPTGCCGPLPWVVGAMCAEKLSQRAANGQKEKAPADFLPARL